MVGSFWHRVALVAIEMRWRRLMTFLPQQAPLCALMHICLICTAMTVTHQLHIPSCYQLN